MNYWELKKDAILVKFGTRTQTTIIELINGKSQTNRDQISAKQRTNRHNYFYNDIINIEKFNSSLLKIDKKWYKDIDIYYIGFITIKEICDCENIYSINPLYLIIGKVNEHIKENNGNKYLVFDSIENHFTDEKKQY